MVLVIDNYDSFTYNLVHYVMECGQPCVVYRNDQISIKELEQLSFDSILISPGPGRPEEAGISMEVIRHYYLSKPILGVCLGLQAMGMLFGGKLERAERVMHGKTSQIEHYGHPLFRHVPNPFVAMRYHSLVIKEPMQPEMEVIARTAENELMAIAHKQLPLVAVQFHPESILSPEGKQLLRNWFSMIQSTK